MEHDPLGVSFAEQARQAVATVIRDDPIEQAYRVTDRDGLIVHHPAHSPR